MDALQELRALGLTNFGQLMLQMPHSQFPLLSSLLPRMANVKVQQAWTGNSGMTLLAQSLDFVRSAAGNFAEITGTCLDGKRILDFGCGYGRLARLMYYITDENNFYGVDPWDKSLEICRDDGLVKNFYLSDFLPTRLPFDNGIRFDLIYAFSVFTHLSERATFACLNTIKDYLAVNGVILITIRPFEYWDFDKDTRATPTGDRLKATHLSKGFAFLPHADRSAVDGDITYGDTSMTLEWLQDNFPNLKIVSLDRSLSDPMQIYIFLQKV